MISETTKILQLLIRDRAAVAPQRVCSVCGCTEANACLDEETGQPCAWVEGYDGDLCTVCVGVAELICYAGESEPEFPDPGEDHFIAPEPLVGLYSDAQANRAIAELRTRAVGL